MDSSIFEAYEKVLQQKTRLNIPYIKGDFIDRLHSRYTITVLVIILALLVLKQYNDTKIVCWLNTELSDDQQAYVHDLCWVNNTYHYPLESDADKFPEHEKHPINYYQYILFIISGQILMFYLPSLAWKVLSSDSFGYINEILAECNQKKMFQFVKSETEKLKKEKEQKNLIRDEIQNTKEFKWLKELQKEELNKKVYMKNFEALKPGMRPVINDGSLMENELHDSQYNEESSSLIAHDEEDFVSKYMNMKKTEVSTSLLKRGNSRNKTVDKPIGQSKRSRIASVKMYLIRPIKGAEKLSLYYFLLKGLNLINVVLQIVGLRFIFGKDFYKYGLDFFNKFLTNSDEIMYSKKFPILTLCDFFVHQNFRKIHYNSTLCLLYINFLIEKFFAIVWFWLIVLLFLTFLNILSWIVEIYSDWHRTGFLAKYIKIKYRMDKKNEMVNKNLIKDFYRQDLGNDGILMMHLLKNAAGDVTFIDILNIFWENYNSKFNKNNSNLEKN